VKNTFEEQFREYEKHFREQVRNISEEHFREHEKHIREQVRNTFLLPFSSP